MLVLLYTIVFEKFDEFLEVTSLAAHRTIRRLRPLFIHRHLPPVIVGVHRFKRLTAIVDDVGVLIRPGIWRFSFVTSNFFIILVFVLDLGCFDASDGL